MGREKDEQIEREEAREAAARAKGRVCDRCGETVPFDDTASASDDLMLCSSCRNNRPKD